MYFAREKKAFEITKVAVKQERVINELKAFQTEKVDMIYNLVKKHPDYLDKILNLLPRQKKYSEEDCLDSPFGFYCGYIDMIRPMELETMESRYLKRIRDLEEERLLLRGMSDTASSFSKEFLGKQKDMLQRIDFLEKEYKEA